MDRALAPALNAIAYNGDEMPHIVSIVEREVAQRRPGYLALPAAVAAAQPPPSAFQGEELDAKSVCPVCRTPLPLR